MESEPVIILNPKELAFTRKAYCTLALLIAKQRYKTGEEAKITPLNKSYLYAIYT